MTIFKYVEVYISHLSNKGDPKFIIINFKIIDIHQNLVSLEKHVTK